MNSLRADSEIHPLRVAAIGAVLCLIGWSAWKCIPAHRATFSESEMTQNRLMVRLARLYTVPAAITGHYTNSENVLQLSPGGEIRYDIAQLSGLLHAIYQVEGPDPAELEICAVGQGLSKLLLKHRLAPGEHSLDNLPYVFLYNTADLPPGTEQVLLRVPATSPSPVNWQKLGSVSREQFPALEHLPLDLISFEAFQPPGWSEPFVTLHAPTKMAFHLPAGHHRLSFQYGYNPATFLDPKSDPDGAEFVLRITTPNHAQEVMKRFLEPSVRPADRELQSARFELDLTEPGSLELIATAGPNNNISWDWLVLNNVRLEPTNPLAATKLP